MGTIPNFVQISKNLTDQLNTLWRNAIRAFVSRIVLDNIVKVDTGMARATLLPLARAVQMFQVASRSIKAKRSRPGYSISAGEALGKQAFDIKYATVKEPILSFIFRIELLHYILQEIGAGKNNSSAWRSLEKGQQAFDAYIKKHANKAINLGMGVTP
jgi:hypothetical protein